jgi:peroxiredoxin
MRMVKYSWLFILLFFINKVTIAKDGYKLTFNINKCTENTVYMCHYYGKESTVYKDDSATVTEGNSTITLESDKKITGGIYMLLYKDQSGRIEFLLNNGDEFTLSFDKQEPVKTMVVKGSKENELFYEYQTYLSKTGEKFANLKAEYAQAKTKKDSTKIQEQEVKVNKEMIAFRNDFCKKYPNTLASTIFNLLSEPEVPEFTGNKNATKEEINAYKYYTYLGNYWSRVNLADDRIIFTPLYERKLDDYLKRLVPKADSINEAADVLLSKASAAPEVFKYTLWYITRWVETSKVMGIEESFVHLAEKYYAQGKATWLADSNIKKYKDRAIAISHTKLDNPAPEVNLPDRSGKLTSISSVIKNTNYTVLVFWSPTCGHCTKEVPKLDSVIKEINKENSVQIIGIETVNEDDEWLKVITKNNLEKNWIHLHDPNRIGNFRAAYDIMSTPAIFLLDNKGILVGKKLDHNNIAGLINFLEKKKKANKG